MTQDNQQNNQQKSPAEVISITSYALRLLGGREYSRAELRQKIIGRFFMAKKTHQYSYGGQINSSEDSPANLQIEGILDDLVREGLQDDDRFTASYIKQSIQRGWGPIKINYKLRNKGISKEMMDTHFPQDKEFWQECASKIAARKYELPLTDIKQKDKCYRFLTGRGFSFEHIRNIVK